MLAPFSRLAFLLESVMGKKRIVKPGDKYGDRVIIKEVDNKKGLRAFLCECKCGYRNEVRLNDLVRGKSAQCPSCSNKTHGLRSHLLYGIWAGIKDRCHNPKGKDKARYKDRGIIVCDEWRDNFKAFYNWAITNGWKKGLQIDRIDNDGNYEPNNCRFVTPRQNALNKRRLNSRNTSGYEGVTWDKSRDKWLASIQIHGNTKTIGRFINKLDAVQARNNFILKNRLENDYKIQELS